jgi:hypothetical protein
MNKWEIWWQGGWDGGWNVYHPDVDLGYSYWELFATWQEAMDFVWEYERAKDWAREYDGWEYLMSYPEDDLEGDIVMGIKPPSAAVGAYDYLIDGMA